MDGNYQINSYKYWQNRFQSDSWGDRDGKGQTRFFINILIGNLPNDIFVDMFNNCKTICDFGCALGQGCEELNKAFHNVKITGLDFSDAAIKQAKELYPALKFRSSPLQPGTDKYDVITCSNVLEHFTNPLDYLELFTKVSQKYIIILVPYECEIFDEHFFSFTENSFPDNINGFNKVCNKIIQCNEPKYWTVKQQLVIYKKY